MGAVDNSQAQPEPPASQDPRHERPGAPAPGLAAATRAVSRPPADESTPTSPTPAASRHGVRSLARELPVMIVLALVLTLLFKTFLAQSFSIPSGSMENTLQVGDHVMVDKLTPWFGARPTRGEVVVFRDRLGWLDAEGVAPSAGAGVAGWLRGGLTFIGLLPPGGYVVKRVIGVGGDEVRCAGGRLSVNGVTQAEPFVAPADPECGADFDVRVPSGRLFVMGDHRSISADSSHHLADQFSGTIAASDVVGAVFVVIWRHGLPAIHPVG